MAAGVLACRSNAPRGDAVASRVGDCFGVDPIVTISARSVGALRLDLPLDSIRRLCTNLLWTTSSGDESLDTAIVITRRGLRAVGVITTVEADGVPYRPVRFDSTTRVKLWKLSGSTGELPGYVPLTAKWRDLRRAYGPLRAFALNGIVYVSVCRHPFLQLLMTPPSSASPINGASQATADMVMAGVSIDMAMIRPSAAAPPLVPPCSD